MAAPVLPARPPPPRKRGLPVRPPPTPVRVTTYEAEAGADRERPRPPGPSAPAAVPLSPPPLPASAKNARKRPRYASPSEYARLEPVADCVAPDMDVLFCGYNPGVVSAERGHHFAGPTNAFWPALSQSGERPGASSSVESSSPLTDVGKGNPYRRPAPASRLQAWSHQFGSQADKLPPPATYPPMRSSSELCSAEMRKEAVKLKDKILKLRPRVVCFVGDGVYKAFSGRPKQKWGQQVETVLLPSAQPWSAVRNCYCETILFVMPSTSGRTVGISRETKFHYFRQLKELRDGLLAEEAKAFC
ncbi:MAG: uracil-DNA glycosylase-like protein [Olpidium bornovanus]|uniref:Uracil-DNA glycosylase-like protein n=1 Tax=Olpidium bornovanus TaxID=278681 RepID=A0A8H8DKS9_9FUNG|nr:MAG: uracil-DNA glycosylase-like protein [Olpidium bornovanus]